MSNIICIWKILILEEFAILDPNPIDGTALLDLVIVKIAKVFKVNFLLEVSKYKNV